MNLEFYFYKNSDFMQKKLSRNLEFTRYFSVTLHNGINKMDYVRYVGST
ncbi:hypothetical protein MHK_006217 [Candidatus Magnetomorum sp. HK-1]|nr:hypothetical protein MHK_006217 [Candidatus Magnetomorum sp. HK-1]